MSLSEQLVQHDRFFQDLQNLIPKKYLTKSYVESQNKYIKNQHVDKSEKEQKFKKPFDVEEIKEEKMTIDKIEQIDVALPDTSIQQLRMKIQDRLKKGADRSAKIAQRRQELEAKKKDKKSKVKKEAKPKVVKTKTVEIVEAAVEIEEAKPLVEENLSLPSLVPKKEQVRHTLPKKDKLKLDLAKARRQDYQKEQLLEKIDAASDEDEKNKLRDTLKDKEWKKAMKRASGEKVKDDVKKIKKSIDRIDKKKEKSRKDWKKRGRPTKK